MKQFLFEQFTCCFFCMIRPCQIGILLSVRVRVGFRVLSPITNLIVKFSYIILMFRYSEKNITIL